MASPQTQRSPRHVPAVAGSRRAWQPGGAGVSPLAFDAVVAVAAAVAALAAMGLSDEPAAQHPDALAYTLLVAAAAPLVVRRRWPSAALLVTSGLTLAYFLLGYPGGPPTLVLLAALYSAAAAGHRWWALAVTVVFAGGGGAYRALVEQEALVGVLLNSALFVLVALLGEAVYSRRALRGEVAERLQRAAEERDREAHRQVMQERMRIARELHDVMAHTVATMVVHAGVAEDTIDDRPDDARAALGTLRRAAREAMTELRATVAVLRDGREGTALSPSPGLAHLDGLVVSAGRAGVAVELRGALDGQALPTAVQMTAYRIIQEALTNVVRHAGANTATVTIAREAAALVVTVDDDGRGPTGQPPAGHGLVGIHERADALGGSAEAGPGPDGGFRVQARLPITEAPR